MDAVATMATGRDEEAHGISKILRQLVFRRTYARLHAGSATVSWLAAAAGVQHPSHAEERMPSMGGGITLLWVGCVRKTDRKTDAEAGRPVKQTGEKCYL